MSGQPFIGSDGDNKEILLDNQNSKSRPESGFYVSTWYKYSTAK